VAGPRTTCRCPFLRSIQLSTCPSPYAMRRTHEIKARDFAPGATHLRETLPLLDDGRPTSVAKRPNPETPAPTRRPAHRGQKGPGPALRRGRGRGPSITPGGSTAGRDRQLAQLPDRRARRAASCSSEARVPPDSAGASAAAAGASSVVSDE